MNDTLEEIKKKATDYSGSTSRKTAKGILGVVIVVLLGALGLQVSGNDFNLGSLLNGQSLSDSKIVTDEKGNMVSDGKGGFVTQYLRDKTGNIVPAGTPGAKYTKDYNCDDFATRVEAQTFFDNAGGVKGDTSRLDGNKDGQACESLPQGTK